MYGHHLKPTFVKPQCIITLVAVVPARLGEAVSILGVKIAGGDPRPSRRESKKLPPLHSLPKLSGSSAAAISASR